MKKCYTGECIIIIYNNLKFVKAAMRPFIFTKNNRLREQR